MIYIVGKLWISRFMSSRPHTPEFNLYAVRFFVTLRESSHHRTSHSVLEGSHLTNNPLQIQLLCNTPGHFAVVSVIDVIAGEEAGTKSVVVGSSQGVLHTSAQLILRDKQ